MRELAKDRDELRRALGVPAEVAADSSPAAGSDLRSAVSPRVRLELDPELVEELADDADAEARTNLGLPVFRVREGGSRLLLAVFGALVGIVPALLAERVFAVGEPLMGPCVLVGALVGLVVGGEKRDRCSGPDCDALLPVEAALCPTCGGTVVGRIARRSDLSAARDAYEEAREAIADGAAVADDPDQMSPSTSSR